MNTRAFTLALVISGMAMFMVYSYIESQKSILIKKFGTEVPVVVAKVDIAELDLIDDSKVTVKSVPQKYKLPGSFKEIKEVLNTYTTTPILKGEQLTKPRVDWPGTKSGLSRQVSVGKRAIALPISERQAVSKLIKPGDRVDVIASLTYAPGRKDLEKTKTILHDVLVLSTGRNISNSIPMIGVKTPREIKKLKLNTYTNYNTITLELTPYEAQMIVFLMTHAGATPFFTLRNNNDKARAYIKSTKVYDLLGPEDATEAKKYFQDKYSGRRRSGR